MCIRDSYIILKGTSAFGNDLYVDDISIDRSEPATPGCILTCLLYTSDAADERSSVDLGGRRIIKKKKTVDIAGYVKYHKKTTKTKLN